MRLIDADRAPCYLSKTACEQIKRMPTIEAEPVRHGKWQPCPIDEANSFGDWFECSVCHSDFEFSEHSIFVGDAEFCPFCGAKMDGDTPETDEKI